MESFGELFRKNAEELGCIDLATFDFFFLQLDELRELVAVFPPLLCDLRRVHLYFDALRIMLGRKYLVVCVFLDGNLAIYRVELLVGTIHLAEKSFESLCDEVSCHLFHSCMALALWHRDRNWNWLLFFR